MPCRICALLFVNTPFKVGPSFPAQLARKWEQRRLSERANEGREWHQQEQSSKSEKWNRDSDVTWLLCFYGVPTSLWGLYTQCPKVDPQEYPEHRNIIIEAEGRVCVDAYTATHCKCISDDRVILSVVFRKILHTILFKLHYVFWFEAVGTVCS